MAAAVRRTVRGLVPLGPSMANAAVRLVSAAQRRCIVVLDVMLDMVNVINLGKILCLGLIFFFKFYKFLEEN
jgi:hypothetical protein